MNAELDGPKNVPLTPQLGLNPLCVSKRRSVWVLWVGSGLVFLLGFQAQGSRMATVCR